MPQSNTQRASIRYGPVNQQPDDEDIPSGLEPGGPAQMVSQMAPRGIKEETMRRSENVEDVRKPAEGAMGAAATIPDELLQTPKEKLKVTFDDVADAMRKSLQGKLKDEDIEEMFPSPDPKARASQMAGEAGTEEQMNRVVAIQRLKDAFNDIKAFHLKEVGNRQVERALARAKNQ